MVLLNTLSLLLQTIPTMQPKALWLAAAGVVVLLTVLFFVMWRFSRSGDDLGHKAKPQTVDDYIAANGTPADVVVLDSTRSNELVAVVLVYDDCFVVDGQRVPREAVTAVTFNNAANPYTLQSYQLVLSTTLPDRPTVKADLGADAGWASEVTQQIAQHII